MNAIKQKAIDKYNRAIADLERHHDAVDLLPDALVEIPGADLYSTDGHLRVDLPMTPTAFRDARRLLGREWTRKGHEWQEDTTGDRVFSFVHQATEVSLSLVLRATAKGATCERRQVGVREVAVYEVVCQ